MSKLELGYSAGVYDMVKAVFTEEDRKNMRTLAEELPRLRLLLEELMETLEILSDEQLMQSIKASEKDIQEGRVTSFKALLRELDFDEEEV